MNTIELAKLIKNKAEELGMCPIYLGKDYTFYSEIHRKTLTYDYYFVLQTTGLRTNNRMYFDVSEFFNVKMYNFVCFVKNESVESMDKRIRTAVRRACAYVEKLDNEMMNEGH